MASNLVSAILLGWRGVDLRPTPHHPPKRPFTTRIATALQCRYILYIVSLGMGLVLQLRRVQLNLPKRVLDLLTTSLYNLIVFNNFYLIAKCILYLKARLAMFVAWRSLASLLELYTAYTVCCTAEIR